MQTKVFIGECAAWAERFVRQSGIPHKSGVPNGQKIWVVADSRLTLDRALGDPSLEVLITTHKILGQQLQLKVRKRKSATLSFQGLAGAFMASLPVWSLIGDAKKPMFGMEHQNANGEVIPGSGIYEISHMGKRVISIPWDLSVLPESRWWRRLFYRREYLSGLSILEISNGVESQVFRTTFFRILERAFQLAGEQLEFLSPKLRSGTVSLFRVDADGFSAQHVRQLATLDETHDHSFSWFIDCLPWLEHPHSEEDINRFLEFRNANPHCYFHQTFLTTKQNSLNLKLAKDAMALFGSECSGTVAPFGMWNAGYDSAVQKAGFHYSSEFSLSEDDLPFLLPSGVLQIPVSSFSLGASKNRDQVWSSRRQEAIEQATSTGAVKFYEHPLSLDDRELAFLTAHLNWLSTFSSLITMDDYASKWRERERYLEAVTNSDYSQIEPPKEFEIINLPSSHGLEEIGESSFSTLPTSRLLKGYSVNYPRSVFFFLLSLIPLRVFISWRKFRSRVVMARIRTVD